MQPQIDIFGVSIKTFGVMFALGFAACGAVLARRLRELDKPVDWAYELVFASLIGGLVGARVYFLIQHWSTVKHDLVGSAFSGSGLVWYGGAIGGGLGVIGWAYWRRMLNWTTIDMSATVLALGYAIGRIGCQLSGDGDYGIRSHLPWAMAYPHGTVPTPPGVTVQPTPIYETVAMCLIAWVLWRLRDRVRPGVVFALYLVLSGLERLLIEFIRRNREVLAGLTAPQLESIAVMIIGGLALAWMVRRWGGVDGLRRGAAAGPRARPVPA